MALDDICFLGAAEPNLIVEIGTTAVGHFSDQLSGVSNKDLFVENLVMQPGATCFAY